MRVLALKHFSFDDESALSAWCERKGHTLDILDPSRLKEYPGKETFGLLVIMGGPMSVYDEGSHPWLADEKRFLLDCFRIGKPILGICLGGQMLAEVLGGTVRRNPHKEIGWHTVRRTEERHPLFEGIPADFTAFQWHGDTFEPPEGAVHLASTAGCVHQAFVVGRHAVGVQFHLEASPTCIETMLDRWSEEYAAARRQSPFVQSKAEIREGLVHQSAAFRLLEGLLDRLEAAAVPDSVEVRQA